MRYSQVTRHLWLESERPAGRRTGSDQMSRKNIDNVQMDDPNLENVKKL